MRQSEMTTFLLRLPQALKRQLEEKAQADKRSVNSTVVDIISRALAVHPTGTSLE
ncbi:MAG: Arc family DNA-binding protein [Ligilactobacillus saerimneri]|nr:Arc family DNA-binding protein [Ligilactobacillus saerimneri]